MASLTAQLIGGPTIQLEHAGLRWLTDPTLSPPGHYGWLDKTNGSAVEADQLRDPRGSAAVWGLIASFYGSPLATSDTRYLDAAGMWTLPTMTANTGLWPRVCGVNHDRVAHELLLPQLSMIRTGSIRGLG
jgi:hypothetical protein